MKKKFMIVRSVTLISLIICVFGVHAETAIARENKPTRTGTLEGLVSDRKGEPLAAVVSFPEIKLPILQVDPVTGRFRKEMAPGKYLIVVEAEGYEPQTKRIKIKAGKEQSAHFKLTRIEKGKSKVAPTVKGKVVSAQESEVIQEFESRARVDKEVEQIMDQIEDLGQELVKLETDLYLLREKVLEGKPVESIAQIFLINELTPIFDIRLVELKLDERVILKRRDEEDFLDNQKETELYREAISPGSHRVEALVSIRGRGRGLFGYFKKYNFELQAAEMIYFSEGETSCLRLKCVDLGGRLELKERLQLKFEQDQELESGEQED